MASINNHVARLTAKLPSGVGADKIRASIVAVFGDMVGRGQFYFMRDPEPVGPWDFTADTFEYDKTVNGADRLVQLEVLPSGETVWSPLNYVPPRIFTEIKAGILTPPGSWWTMQGVVSPFKFRIHFYPTPTSASGQFRIYKLRQSDKGTISLLPTKWFKTLDDGVMADLKDKLPLSDRTGMTGKDTLYQRGANRMAATEHSITTAYEEVFRTSTWQRGRNLESVDLQ